MNNRRTVVCISERVTFPNQIEVGTKYTMDTNTLWSDCDGTWYVDIYTIEGVRVGSMDITHFRDI